MSDIPQADSDSAIARLVSGFAEALALLDLKTGEVAYWNAAAERLTGLEAKAVLGRPLVERLAPEAHGRFAACLHQPTAPFVLDLLDAAQGRRPIELSINHVSDGARCWGLVILRRLQSEAQRILDSAFQGVLRVDEQACVTYANARMAKILGYAPGELEGKSLFELVPADQRDALRTYVARRENGIGEQFEFCMARKDGSPIWMLVVTNPLLDAQGRYSGAIAMITDLQERRTAEMALRESEALWRSLFEYAPQTIMLIDRQRRIAFLSRGLRAEAVGRSIFEFVPDEERGRVEAAYAAVFDQAQRVDFECPIHMPDGETRWLETHVGPMLQRGEVRYALAIVSDVHERKLAEERLRRSEQQLANAQQLAQVGWWEYFPEEDRAIWSDEVYRIFGLPSDRPGLPRDEFAGLIPPEEREQVVQEFARTLSEPGKVVVRFRVLRADGSERHVHAIAESTFEGGRAVRSIGVMQDVTEFKRAYEEVAKRTAELERAQELDALKSNFVNSVSHELRTPLTSILGYAEFLEDEVAGPISGGQREFVQEIISGARRLEHLVDDLLDFARIDAGTFKLRLREADLTDKIREIVASLAPQAQAGRLHLEIDAPDTLSVRMDPQRVGQVLINLLTNAVKFTPAGGTITVHARQEGDLVRCEVEDTGEGIAAEQLDRLFVRFSQLPSGAKRGGAGLGLSISKTLVEMHGGTIGVRSVPGQGATFWFTLPLKGPQTGG